MMGAMARPRAGTPHRPGMRRCGSLRVAAATAALPLVLAGCTSPAPPPPEPSASGEQVALRVTTAPGGARELSAAERADLEGAVGAVLTRYVVSGFLGDYPRDRFVDSFDDFTGGAAGLAAQNLDVLTAARVEDATAVEAQALEAQLYFGVDEGDVFGATANVDFAFEASMSDGATQDVTLAGRLMLVEQDGQWSVIGFDVAGDDGAPVGEEAP